MVEDLGRLGCSSPLLSFPLLLSPFPSTDHILAYFAYFPHDSDCLTNILLPFMRSVDIQYSNFPPLSSPPLNPCRSYLLSSFLSSL